MNKTLAKVAENALTQDGFVKTAGYCQKWIRQVLMKTYGKAKYEKYFERYMAASAYETMLNFQKSPYAISAKSETHVGDILYKGRKTSGRFGHVGCRVMANAIAENSSSHVGPDDNDARGKRSLSAFGAWELTVRLGEPDDLA